MVEILVYNFDSIDSTCSETPTFSVMSMERNFLLSPIKIQLDTQGRHSLTLSSIRTGGMFSPPAVIINSVSKNKNKKVRVKI